nr:hypothetical protein A5881_000391 [Enterococcus termitis]
MLEVKNLVKTFGDYTAVNNMSFEIPDGKILGPVSYTHLDVYKRQVQYVLKEFYIKTIEV